MNKIKAYTLTILLSTFAFVPKTRAATIVPPISQQVNQVGSWFTGFFDNRQQVASNSSVPLITMYNCEVQLQGINSVDSSQTIYLEQTTGGFPFRTAFYSFSEGSSGVELSVSRFIDPNPLIGLCDRPASERVVDLDNISPQSCDFQLAWQPELYTANNAPNGCLTASGLKVVSDVTIGKRAIDSLDLGFDLNDKLVFGTKIEFLAVTSIPESSLALGLLTFGFLGMGLRVLNKQKSIKNEQLK